MTHPELHRRIRRHWTEHPHAYHVLNGDAAHAEPTWADFRNVDRKVFKHHAPWAHEGFPLLSRLVPYDELAGLRVLDLGCGTGWGLEQLLNAGADACGLDLSPTHLRWTGRRLASAGRRAQVAEGDGERLPFGDATFDYVLCWGVLMHAAHPERLAREIARVLRPGGRAGVMLYHRGSLHWRWTIHFLHGYLGLERLRYSAEEVARRHTNDPEVGGSPVARAYSREEARALFADFADVRVEVNDLPRAMGFFPSRRLPLLLALPTSWRRCMARRIGWHLWIEGTR